MPDLAAPGDPFEALMVRIGADLAEYEQGLDRAGQRARNFARHMQGVGRRISRVGTIITGVATAMAGLAVRDAYKLSRAMAEVSTIADTTTISLERQQEAIERLSRVYHLDAVDAARALYQTYSSGIEDAAEALAFLEVAGRLSVATMSRQEITVDALTTALNAYGRSSEDADKFSGVFFETIRLGKVRMDDINSSMGRTITIAAQVGVQFEEVMAAMASMSKKGMSAHLTMTSLRSMLAEVLQQEDKTVKAASSLGIAWDITSIKAMGFTRWLESINEATGGNVELMGELFNAVRALPAALMLAGEGFESYVTILDQLYESLGKDTEAMERVQESDAWKLKEVMKAWDRVKQKLGKALFPALTELTKRVSKVIDSWSDWIAQNEALTSSIVFNIVKWGLFLTILGKVIYISASVIRAVVQTRIALHALAVHGGQAAAAVYGLELALAGLATAYAGYRIGKYLAEKLILEPQQREYDRELQEEKRHLDAMIAVEGKYQDTYMRALRRAANERIRTGQVTVERLKEVQEALIEVEWGRYAWGGAKPTGQGRMGQMVGDITIMVERITAELDTIRSSARKVGEDAIAEIAGGMKVGMPRLFKGVMTSGADELQAALDKAFSDPLKRTAAEFFGDELKRAELAVRTSVFEQARTMIQAARRDVEEVGRTGVGGPGGKYGMGEKAAWEWYKDLVGEMKQWRAEEMGKRLRLESEGIQARSVLRQQELVGIREHAVTMKTIWMKEVDVLAVAVKAQEDLLKQYQSRVDQIRGDAKSAAQEVSDRVFELQQKFLRTDYTRWMRERKRAKEFEAEGRRAAGRGEQEEAQEWYRRAMDQFEGLARGVKGRRGRQIGEREATYYAGRNIEAVGALLQASFDAQEQQATKLVNDTTTKIADLQSQVTRLYDTALRRTLAIKPQTEDAKDALLELYSLLGKLEDKVISVTVRRRIVEARQFGGMVGDDGLRIGTDRIHALLTPGEFVVRREAAMAFRPWLETINRLGAHARDGVLVQPYGARQSATAPPVGGSAARGGDINIHLSTPVDRDTIRRVLVPEINRARRRGQL